MVGEIMEIKEEIKEEKWLGEIKEEKDHGL